MIKMIQDCLIKKQNRLEELRSYNLSNTEPEKSLDQITYIAKEICQSDAAYISFIDDEHQWLKSKIGIDVFKIPIKNSLCLPTITKNETSIITFCETSPEWSNNPILQEFTSKNQKSVFYVGVPIITPSGYKIGTLSILDSKLTSLNPQQHKVLQHLSSQIISQLELHKHQNFKDAQKEEIISQITHSRDNTLKAYEQSLNKYALVTKINLDGTTSYVNDKFCEISEYDRDELLNQQHFIFTSENQTPFDVKKIWSAIESGRQWKCQFKNKTKNNEFYWIDTTITPVLNAQNEVESFVTFSYEITQEKNIEEHLQLVVSNTFDGIWDWDMKTGSEYMSPRFWEILGFQPDEKNHLPEEWQALILDEDLETAQENLQKHIGTDGRYPYHQEVRFRHKDGHLVWILRQGKVVEWDQDGNPLRMIGSHSDITQLKETQSKLLYNSKMVAIGEMAGGIAHEINNPLAIINASAGTMLRKNKNNKLDATQIEKYATQIENTVDRIAQIITGLRNFSRDSKLDKLDICKASDIMKEARSLCTEKFKNKGILLTQDIDPDLNISCKRVELTQVIVNLLNNAFDAVMDSPSETKEIHMFLGKVQDRTLIYIEDSGAGISPDIAEKIMQPFFTTKPVGKGTGLGLSISRGIIESIGGEFSLCGKSERTRFCIELPLVGEDQIQAHVA